MNGMTDGHRLRLVEDAAQVLDSARTAHRTIRHIGHSLLDEGLVGQSMAFFSAPGTERLYSAVTTI